VLARELVERFAGDEADEVTEEEEVDVGVDDTGIKSGDGYA
jgi:hypothetical protein